MALTLTSDERAELKRRVRRLNIRTEDARRARVILMLAAGDSYSTINATVRCYRDYINRWRRRFLADRLDGLRARDRGHLTILTPTMATRTLDSTRQSPPDGSTHWSARTPGRLLKIHHSLVAKMGCAPACSRIGSGVHAVGWSRLRTQGRRGHRLERESAVVFAVDEKTAMQALDRLDPVLPLSLGRAEQRGFDY